MDARFCLLGRGNPGSPISRDRPVVAETEIKQNAVVVNTSSTELGFSPGCSGESHGWLLTPQDSTSALPAQRFRCPPSGVREQHYSKPSQVIPLWAKTGNLGIPGPRMEAAGEEGEGSNAVGAQAPRSAQKPTELQTTVTVQFLSKLLM